MLCWCLPMCDVRVHLIFWWKANQLDALYESTVDKRYQVRIRGIPPEYSGQHNNGRYRDLVPKIRPQPRLVSAHCQLFQFFSQPVSAEGWVTTLVWVDFFPALGQPIRFVLFFNGVPTLRSSNQNVPLTQVTTHYSDETGLELRPFRVLSVEQ